MKNKIVAIGDLHGHYDQFMQIMDKFMANDWYGLDPEKDTFVFLGDYVDGGPDTKAVLEELIVLKERFPHWKFLFGNHESLFLDGMNPRHPLYGDYYLWFNQGGAATIESYKPRQSVEPTEYERYQRALMKPSELIPESHWDFIRNLDLYYETPEYFFVHGGIYPNRSIEDHKKSIEDAYPNGFDPLLMQEGDMAYDMIWMRNPFIASDFDWKKRIVFGHTTWPYQSFLGIDPDNNEEVDHPGYPLIMKNKIGLDTMMHNEGRLTALILSEGTFIFSDFTRDNT